MRYDYCRLELDRLNDNENEQNEDGAKTKTEQ